MSSIQSLPVRPSGKENSIAEPYSEGDFSQHLNTKSAEDSDPEKSGPVGLFELEPQTILSDQNMETDIDSSTEDGLTIDTDIELMSVMPQSVPLDTANVFNELRLSQLIKSFEPEITKAPTGEKILVPSSEMENEEAVLMEPSEIVVELAVANNKFPTADQNLGVHSRNFIKAVSPIAALGNGIVSEPKPVREKNARLSLSLPANSQTSIVVKSNTDVQNLLTQQDTSFQPNIALPQERGTSNDTGLEKTFQLLDLKASTTSVTVESSPQKLSVETNVPSLSQPGQTLVRAIQENSNWTKVLSSSSVQFNQTPKVDGTVLQKLDIHLNLADLGKLDVKLRLHQGELQVQIRADSEKAYKMLSVDQDVLTNTIKGLGYKVDSIAISGPRSESGFQLNSNSQPEGQHHSAEQHNQNEKSSQRSDRDFMPMKDAENEKSNLSSSGEHSSADANII